MGFNSVLKRQFLWERRNSVMNCWEFNKCDRWKSCTVYPSHGRECALILGTLCNGQKQETYNDKIHHCLKCDFFRSVYHVKYVD